MWLLAACLAAHALLARLIPSPWWVPDLTLIGLVLTVSRQPDRWLLACAIAGLFTAIWAARLAAAALLGALICGALLRLGARRWDATDARVQGAALVVLSALTTLGLLWLERLWSWPLLALAAARVSVTGASLRVIQRLLR
jgi:hypothetical protein